MTNPNISELLSTGIENRTGELVDNVATNTALLSRLKDRKTGFRPVSGGTSIYQELAYAENSTFMFYDGTEVLNVSASDVATAAEFAWKQAAVAVVVSGKEERINSGKERTIDLVKARIENAMTTMTNKMSEGVYSDGTGTGGKQIGGLQYLVADAPTNTVGGINRSLYSFWANKVVSGTTITAANIQSKMNELYLQLVAGADRPDLIVADNNFYKLYLESLQAIQRVGPENKLAAAGFSVLKYMDADVVLDGGYGGDAPTSHMYMLNTKYLHYRPHKDCNMVPLNPDRFAVNQDAYVKLIGWMGNMTISHSGKQGVLTN